MKWEPNAWLAKQPSTNYIIFTAGQLASLVVIRCVLVGVHLDLGSGRSVGFATWDPPVDLLILIAGMAGIGTTQFGIKRKTHIESPPQNPDVEDAPAIEQQKADKIEDSEPVPDEPAPDAAAATPLVVAPRAARVARTQPSD